MQNIEGKNVFEPKIFYLAKLLIESEAFSNMQEIKTIYHPWTIFQRITHAKQKRIQVRGSHRLQETVGLTQDCSEKQFQRENFEAGLEGHQSKLELKVRGPVKNLFWENMDFL